MKKLIPVLISLAMTLPFVLAASSKNEPKPATLKAEVIQSSKPSESTESAVEAPAPEPVPVPENPENVTPAPSETPNEPNPEPSPEEPIIEPEAEPQAPPADSQLRNWASQDSYGGD